MKWQSGLKLHTLFHCLKHILFYFSDHEWRIRQWPILEFRHSISGKITEYNLLKMSERPEAHYEIWMGAMKKDSGNELRGDIRGAYHDPFVLGPDTKNAFVDRHKKKLKKKLKPKKKLKRKLKR